MTSPPASIALLTLRLLGEPDLRVAGRPLAALRSRKDLYPLLLLALRAGRPMDRIALAETLWPDATRENALKYLRRSLMYLRRALGDAADRLQSPTPRTLRLDLAGCDVDLVAFDRDPEAHVSLYAGELLAGIDDDWVLPERRARAEAHRRARLRLAAHSSPERAILHLRRLLDTEPDDEEAARHLMEALAARGDTNAALALYRDLRERLYRESLASPDPSTTALYQRLRASGGAAPAPALPAPPCPSGPPSAIPSPRTPLVGRSDACAAVRAALAQSRLVSVVGPGGMGKTRLSLAVAAAEPRAWFVDVTAARDPEGVVYTAVSALGLTASPGVPPREALACALQSADGLLIVDNAESSLAGCAALIDLLLARCPQVRILATSRAPLGVDGEAIWAIPPLPADEAAALLAGRATALAQPPPPELVAALCRRLDGIPLAIELAASRLRVLSGDELLERLDTEGASSPRLLAHSAQPERHRTLRAVLDGTWSWLDESQRATLGALAVFADGFSRDAARTVAFPDDASEYDVLDALAQLTERSLVVASAEGRFRLLEPIRDFASEQASGALRAAARRRWLDWCARLVESAMADGLAGMLRLDPERENLRAALSAADPDEALTVAAALGEYWTVRGAFAEAADRYAELLAIAAPDHPARALALYEAGRAAQAMGDPDTAERLLRESLALHEAQGNVAGCIGALGNLGLNARNRGRPDEAERLYTRCLALSEAAGLASEALSASLRLGVLAGDRGDDTTARARFEEGAARARALNARVPLATALMFLGDVHRRGGRFDDAREIMEESVALMRAAGYRLGLADALHGSGTLARDSGDRAAARGFFEESLLLYQDLGDASRVRFVQAAIAALGTGKS